MKVELTADAAQWVEAEIAAGTFLTPEDAVRYAVSEVRAKLDPAAVAGSIRTTADAQTAAEPAGPKRTPQEAAARMLEMRKGNFLPEGMTIRDLQTYGRA